jgi:gluconate kinase
VICGWWRQDLGCCQVEWGNPLFVPYNIYIYVKSNKQNVKYIYGNQQIWMNYVQKYKQHWMISWQYLSSQLTTCGLPLKTSWTIFISILNNPL